VTTMELKELLRKAEGADVDFLREGVRVLAQALMDAEVSAWIHRSAIEVAGFLTRRREWRAGARVA
jgi:hypothetical protein